MRKMKEGWGRNEVENVLGYDTNQFVNQVEKHTDQNEQNILQELQELYNKNPKFWKLVGGVAATGILINHFRGSSEDEGEQPLEIVVYDVKHGNFILILTPNGKTIVQDLGQGSYDKSSETWSPLKHLNDNWDINKLDYAVVTHPDLDHIEDIQNLDRYTVDNFVRPIHLTEEEIMENVRESDRGVFQSYVNMDTHMANLMRSDQKKLEISPEKTGGVEITFFRPKENSTSNFNNHSIVTVVEYGDKKMVLPGDNEAPSWRELLEMDDFVESIEETDIFLAPHHGREDGFCEDIFDHFNPKLTVVSDGEYGDTSATSKYNRVTEGYTVLDTDGNEDSKEVVTTRKDGYIRIEAGYEEKPYLKVTKGD
jgi:beta-lactamase superfamily II metal-dependent hydrolase